MANTITVVRGDSKNIPLTFTDGNGLPIDITGYTIFFTVKTVSDTSADDTSAVIQKDVIAHTDPTNGITVITLDDTDTAITPATYVYDIQTKDTSNKILTPVIGDFVVTKDVTKRTA